MDAPFSGFEESKKSFTGIPDQFFSEILPAIDDLNELKVVLYLLWSAHTEGDYGLSFNAPEIMADEKFSKGLIHGKKKPGEVLQDALQSAVEDNILIEVEKDQRYYFLNTPRGRAGARLFMEEEKQLFQTDQKATLDIIKPNIFQLYEENIGPLTPLIADALRDARESYPENWIHEAIQIAVKNNVRRWKYVESILTRWQEEGRDGTDQRDAQKDYERYIKGEYGDIGKHW